MLFLRASKSAERPMSRTLARQDFHNRHPVSATSSKICLGQIVKPIIRPLARAQVEVSKEAQPMIGGFTEVYVCPP